LGIIRPWMQAPRDQALSSEMQDFLQYVAQSLANLQGSATPIPAPSGVATVGYPNGVQITWNEIPLGLADHYVVYENTINQSGGTVVGTVTANRGGSVNKYFRSGISDTTTRYYSVQGYSATTPGAISAAVKGTALTSGVSTMDAITDGPTTFFKTTANQRDGGGRGFNTLTSSNNLVSGTKLGGDSGVTANGSGSKLGLGGTPSTYTFEFSSSDVYITSGGTVKVRINNGAGHQWSVASV
jgi:hypothetical protein